MIRHMLLFVLLMLAHYEVFAAQSSPDPAATSQAAAKGSAVQGDSAAQGDSAVAEQKLSLSSEISWMQALEQEAKPEEVAWLEASYPGETKAYRFLALQQAPRTPAPQGAVLILPDLEQHADWPYLIRLLRRKLPDEGWQTLSITLPKKPLPSFPARTAPAKTAEQYVLDEKLKTAMAQANAETRRHSDKPAGNDAATKKPANEPAQSSAQDAAGANDGKAAQSGSQADAASAGSDGGSVIDVSKQTLQFVSAKLSYQDRANAHVKSAFDYLKEKGFENVILIGYRAGADLALNYIKPLAADIPGRGFGLIMVDPRLSFGYQSDIGNALGQQFQAPVLDIINRVDLNARELGLERAGSARKNQIKDYNQIRLTVRDDGELQRVILSRIKDWLKIHAPGMEATKVGN